MLLKGENVWECESSVGKGYDSLEYVISYLGRLTEKEMEYKEQSSVKLQEWVKALTPLQEWFVKSEQKLDSLENLEPNMNNLKRQNQEYLVSLLGLFSFRF